MPTQLPSRSRAAGIVGPLAALFVVTLLCGTAPDDAQLLAKRRQRIAGMSHAEIEQLKRNYDEFRKMSPERRQALEELDNEVKQDATGHLLKLLTGYNRWLSTLSPFDQERILSQSDPIERAQLVKTIHEEQQKRQALAGADGIGRQSLLLEPTDLDALCKAVEDNFLTPESRKKIPEQVTGRNRHLRVLSAAQSQLRDMEKAAAASQALVTTLIDAIPNQNVRSRILNQTAQRQRRRMLGQGVGRSLVNEWQSEIARAFPPQAVIDQEIAKRLVGGTTPTAKRDAQKAQLMTRQGRRMVGVQIVLRTDEQFKEFGSVYFWLTNGLQPRTASRGQMAAPQDDMRTDEAENKTKAGD
jgi:hypothetical protein